MRDETRKYLHDMREAVRAIQAFVAGKSFPEYVNNELLRSGVERKFEIIGEALNRIQKESPEILGRIHAYREIISFRNILAHGYDSIDDSIVWEIIEKDIGDLLKDIESLLTE